MTTTVARDGQSELSTFRDAQTGREIWQLTRSDQASFHSYYDLCPWSPDGTKIVFCGMTPGQNGADIYWLDVADGTIHWCGHSQLAGPHEGAQQQWLGADARIAYKDRDDDGLCVRIVDLATGARARLPGTLRMAAPDGRRFASHTDTRDEVALAQRDTAGLFLSSLDGAAPRLLVSLAAALAVNPRRDEIAGRHLYIKHPKWSPAGDRLMFVFTNEIHFEQLYGEPRVKDVYVVNADGTNPRYVCDFALGHHPSWHPDGQHIFLNRRPAPDQPHQFLLVDVDTGLAAPATTAIEGSGHPSFSPDGQRFLAEYVTKPLGGAARVVCMNLAANRADDLAHFTVVNHTHQGTHIHPTWSRDGRFALFNADYSGHAEVYVAPMA
jgi:dipeptidyl aminopeptidase/acylaminoacyl peptidase